MVRKSLSFFHIKIARANICIDAAESLSNLSGVEIEVEITEGDNEEDEDEDEDRGEESRDGRRPVYSSSSTPSMPNSLG